MVVEKRTASWIMSVMAFIALLASIKFFGYEIPFLGALTLEAVFTLGASIALALEVGLVRMLKGKPTMMEVITLLVAGAGLSAGILTVAGVQVMFLDAMAGLINFGIFVLLLYEINR